MEFVQSKHTEKGREEEPLLGAIMAMRRFVDEQIQRQINHTRDQVSQGMIDAVDQLLGKLISLVKDQVSLVLDLDVEIKFLKKVLPKLNVVILNAEVTTGEMAELRKVLKDFVEVAEDIVDEFDTELARRNPSPIADRQRNNCLRRCIVWAGLLIGEQRSKTLVKLVCGCFPSSLCSHSCDHESVSLFFYGKIANQIKGLYGGLETLKNDRDRLFKFVDSAIKGLGVVREQTIEAEGLPRRTITYEVPREDVELVGRERDKEEVMKLLLKPLPKPSVVLVMGMGGIGKTTLAQHIFSVPDFDEHFQIKEWVCVGNGLDVQAVLQKIFGEGNRDKIQSAHLKGERFLIVLDDCWLEKMEGWNALWNLLSHGGEGSKVLITSRQDVSKKLEGVRVRRHQLGVLSNDKCLQIFKFYAFPDGVSSSSGRLQEIGRKIVDKKIRGVPLAARVLGSSLRDETEEVAWNSVLKEVSNDIVMSALMWSYRRLPSHLKQCFAFWSLLPKDCIIYKNNMVWMWIAFGYVQPRANQKLEYIGENYFDYLVRASLIQNAPDYRGELGYTMHDLLHDLAINVSRAGYIFPNSNGAIENQTFMEEHSDNRRLRILIDCNLEDMRTSDNRLQYVRVLAFHYARPTIAINFSNMVHLRYLDLSELRFDSLPESIYSIYNLQTLLLYDMLEKFPSSTWMLPNLRHLGGGRYMKVDGIGNSKSLQTISDFNLFNEKDIEELENLQELRGRLKITHLNHIQSGESALEARLSAKEHIEELILEWDVNNSGRDAIQNEILENLCPHGNLRIIEIRRYMGDKPPSWMGGNQLLELVKLTLCRLHRLKELPPLGHLHHLEYLHVEDLREVQFVRNEFYGTEQRVFPSLKELCLINMVTLEEWKEYSLPRDRVTSWFPSLEFLKVDYCQQLRSLPDIPRHLKKLIILSTGLKVLPKMWTSSNDSESQDLPSLHTLNIHYCPSLEPDQWFREYRMPSLVELELVDVNSCKDLVIYYSRKCLKDIVIKDAAALESVTLYNIVPSEEFRKSDYSCQILLLDLRVLKRMTVVNCGDGNITAGTLRLSARGCNPISLLQADGSKFEPHGESTFIYGDFV